MKKRSPPPIPLQGLTSIVDEQIKTVTDVDGVIDLEKNISPVLFQNQQDKQQTIDIDLIDSSPYQNRVFNKKSDVFIADLASNIDKDQLNSPILVRKLNNGRYELIAGENRLRSFKSNGQSSIPAIIKEFTDLHAAKATVLDNVFHSPLSAFELYRGYKTLIEMNAYSSQAQLAKEVNVSAMEMTRIFSFGKLPEVCLKKIEENPHQIGSATAYNLIKFVADYPDLVIKAVEKIIDEKMDQGRAVGWIDSIINPKSKKEDRTITNISGKTIFTLSSNKNNIQIIVTEMDSSKNIENKIFALLEEEAKSEDIKS
jgi:ParB family chromosome partitioning protein